MVPELILFALLFGWVFGGKFGRLADAKIKNVWLIFVPLGLYLVSWAPPLIKLPWFLGTCAIIEKIALVVVAVSNIRLPGMKIALAGVVLNLIALSVNGGMMPATAQAVAAAFGADFLEKTRTAAHVRSAIMNASTELGFLCDIVVARRPFVAVPAVYSIGDLIMSAGIFVAIIGLMRTPLPGEKKDRQVGDNAG